MTEVEDLIKQAEEVKANWQKPQSKSKPTDRTWQEILDDVPYPQLRYGKL